MTLAVNFSNIFSKTGKSTKDVFEICMVETDINAHNHIKNRSFGRKISSLSVILS